MFFGVRGSEVGVFLAGVVLLLPVSTASAQSMGSMQKATELGSILASEEFCGLSYNQDAIGSWIDEHTDPSNMGFTSTLNMMTEGSKFQMKGMSESSKTAHCRSVARTARHFGFIE